VKDASPLNPHLVHTIAGLDFLNHIHAGDDLPEDSVLAIEVRLGEWQMKNCDPPVSLPAWAIESEPAL
jgi:hypothetical protein